MPVKPGFEIDSGVRLSREDDVCDEERRTAFIIFASHVSRYIYTVCGMNAEKHEKASRTLFCLQDCRSSCTAVTGPHLFTKRHQHTSPPTTGICTVSLA